jgi:hypothetical protein
MRRRDIDSWPSWSPHDLRVAHAALTALSPDKWHIPTLQQIMKRSLGQTAEAHLQLVGLGTKTAVLKILRQLATDLRLKSSWEALQRTETEVRKKFGSSLVILSEPSQSISCHIARLCISAQIEASTRPVNLPTKKRWKKRHDDIAKVSKQLAELLRTDGITATPLLNIASLFTQEALREFAKAIFGDFEPNFVGRWPGQAPEDYLSVKARWAALSETQMDSALAIDEADWDDYVISRQGSVLECMEQSAPKLDRLLLTLSYLADLASQDPPHFGSTEIPKRVGTYLSEQLSDFFVQAFGKPLDEIVASIVSVTMEVEISASSVKMHRVRLGKIQRRLPK